LDKYILQQKGKLTKRRSADFDTTTIPINTLLLTTLITTFKKCDITNMLVLYK